MWFRACGLYRSGLEVSVHAHIHSPILGWDFRVYAGCNSKPCIAVTETSNDIELESDPGCAALGKSLNLSALPAEDDEHLKRHFLIFSWGSIFVARQGSSSGTLSTLSRNLGV